MKAPPVRAVRMEQPPRAADRADARVAAVRAGRIEVRRQDLVDLVQHLADAQVRRLGDGGREVAPEPGQHVLVVGLARADLVELVLETGGEVVLHVAAEVVGQERRDEAALVLGDQAVLVLARRIRGPGSW